MLFAPLTVGILHQFHASPCRLDFLSGRLRDAIHPDHQGYRDVSIPQNLDPVFAPLHQSRVLQRQQDLLKEFGGDLFARRNLLIGLSYLDTLEKIEGWIKYLSP